MNSARIYKINDLPQKAGPVVYWMSRDQRTQDNWAMIFAQELAVELKVPLGVVFCLAPDFLDATIRQYGFMLKGLSDVERNLSMLGISFILLQGTPEIEIPRFLHQHNVSALVTDFDPLTIKRQWKERIAGEVGIPMYDVDAHNIVPCRIASPKQEFGAYTIRPKIRRLMAEFLDEFPPLIPHPFAWSKPVPNIDWQSAHDALHVGRNVPEVDWITPGEDAATSAFKMFIQDGLADYPSKRNDPSQNGQSGMSPYLHFGQISAQRIALEIRNRGIEAPEFLEELIVRRELADNFCFYNADYDNTAGFPNWAKKTLSIHDKDIRPVVYTLEEFEQAETDDPLWNAAQMEMVKRGKMHGYMRMYWAKKILEWTESSDQAMKFTIYLNNRYELDGRDLNGYTGIAWSIGGVHDRAWGERPIFGKIRYMSYNGCKSKFDVKAYISKVSDM
ncbi:MAG: deoxyribodipyrimidine photo-lyase [Armatimonadota bacterium]